MLNVCDEAQERRLGRRSNETDSVVIILHPIMSPMLPIVASILDVKRATQNSRVGVTGMGSGLGFCSKRRSRSQIAAEERKTAR